MRRTLLAACVLGLVAGAGAATALADRDAYVRRATERIVELFRMADADRDGVVTRDEARGAVELEAEFDDIDASRDGLLSEEELTRYLAATYGAVGR